MHKAQIMDVTIRDGSYAINFQFTASDTSAIAGALEKAGIILIEVRHGVDQRASAAKHGEAAKYDEVYLREAESILIHSNINIC